MEGRSLSMAYALLAQAVILQAMKDGKDSFFKSESYLSTWEPMIDWYNESHPNSSVTNPAHFKKQVEITEEDVKKNADTYFICVFDILKEMGVDCNLVQVYKDAIRYKWITPKGFLDKPLMMLFHYTGRPWTKRVISYPSDPVTLKDGEYGIYKKYVRGGRTCYERVYGTLELKLKVNRYLIFSMRKMEESDERGVGSIKWRA